MITKPISNNHRHTSKTSKIDIRGGSVVNLPSSEVFIASRVETCGGIIVGCNVLVSIGKIKVIAGNGRSVVVGVIVGDEAGVDVWEGVVEVLIGDCVLVFNVADPVTITLA
jgi:hypothetical protein